MKMKKKAQTSMILLVIVIIIFAALGIFLFSLAQTVSPKDYMNMYTHNLLLSILRADTGSHDPECKYVSDLISCSFFMPSTYQCSGLDMTCQELAQSRIDYYMSKYADLQKSFRYLLTVNPKGFLAKTPEGEALRIEFGDSSLKDEKVQKWSANELIQRVSGMTEYYLTVNLLISVRE
ncbi:MAG: hypothetical protein KAU24_03210 [Candidatus Aenigmarchaeota archaeon]|nr:hypothetical protein [Candidatus Aenigmarchaeota archaeon]